MKTEDKELLLKDLCARLPYKVQCEIGGLKHGPYTFTGDDVEDLIIGRMFKPYLRPMSSMTEKECEERIEIFGKYCPFDSSPMYIDWLLEHHFDFRGLIKKGLALEAPEGMYNIE